MVLILLKPLAQDGDQLARAAPLNATSCPKKWASSCKMMMSHYGKGLVNPPIGQLVNQCKRIENDSIRSICFKLLRSEIEDLGWCGFIEKSGTLLTD
jgi:hypothetical protein